MTWWEDLADDALEGGVKGGLRWAWQKIGPRREIEPKTVATGYPVKTGLDAQARAENLELRWTAEWLIDERLGEGWEFVFEPSDGNTKRKLRLWYGSVLLQRKRNLER